MKKFLHLSKPYLAPSIILLFELGLTLSGFESGWLGGFLIGAALCWFMANLLSHKELVVEHPWLVDWLPFLAMTEKMIDFDDPSELRESHIFRKVIRLTDVAVFNEIEDKVFEECIIHGPAIIAGEYFLERNSFDPPAESVFVYVPQESIKGMVKLKNCVIRKCKLHGIGILVSEEQRKYYLQQQESGEAFGSPPPKYDG